VLYRDRANLSCYGNTCSGGGGMDEGVDGAPLGGTGGQIQDEMRRKEKEVIK